MILIGILNFNYEEDTKINSEIIDRYEFEMIDNLSINSWDSSIQYVEKDIDNVEIEVKHSRFLETSIYDGNEEIEIYCNQDEAKILEIIRTFVDDINNKKINNYNMPSVYIYASKENIEKIKLNAVTRETQIESLNAQIEWLNRENYNLNNEIISLEERLEEYEY